MKRGILFLLLMFAISIILSSCGSSLSEEELQKRAEEYSLLIDTLQTVGYDNDFKLLKERNSIEQNLRILWAEYFSHATVKDARKNVELLILLGNFDFIAEGLRSKASSDNPYYNDWPRDSQNYTLSRTVSFSNEEVLWLMLLLPDSDFPEEYFGLKGILDECGENVLGKGLFGCGTSEGIWFYYEKTCPGLLEKVNPDFPDYFSDEIKAAFKNADDDIQNRFMQAIDVNSFRKIH